MKRCPPSPAVLVTALLALPALATAGTGPTIRCVNRADRECQTQHGSIGAAITAANDNDVILVGPGIYTEAVLVDKTVHLFGAQAGVDARTRPDDALAESIVDGGSGGTSTIIVQATGVVIDGFTIQGGLAGNATGLDLKGGTSPANAARVLNNILQKNSTGLSLNSEGFEPVGNVFIEHNLFRNNNEGDQAVAGDGIFTSACQDVAVNENKFAGHLRLALGINNSVGVSVTNNESDGDARFVVLTGTRASNISNNTIRNVISSGFFGMARAAAISIRKGNFLLNISHNVVGPGQAGTFIRGIQIGGDAGVVPPNFALTIAHNTITGMPRHGIVAEADRLHDSFIIGNVVARNGGDGISIASDDTGNVLTGNRSRRNGGFDCRDASTGSGTLGTANTWLKNNGLTSVPAGLCGNGVRR